MAYRNLVEENDMFYEDEQQPNRPWLDAKETAKLLARNRQELISNELSRLAADEYLEDIMVHLRHMEVRWPHLPLEFLCSTFPSFPVSPSAYPHSVRELHHDECDLHPLSLGHLASSST
jgi:hypothetical protein